LSGETSAAVDRPITTRLERHRGVHAALRANGFEVRALRGLIALSRMRSAHLAAIAAALGLVLEALFRKKLLLAGSKYELRPAVLTGECFVFQGTASTRFWEG
jgi:hypothetical protein